MKLGEDKHHAYVLVPYLVDIPGPIDEVWPQSFTGYSQSQSSESTIPEALSGPEGQCNFGTENWTQTCGRVPET